MVTTNFNYGDYLEDCMSSIISSPGSERVDYVVMDGGSTDGSVEIIKKYEPHLKHWQSEKDDGMYHAIEAGFAHSNAPYMGWLNSDDKLAPWAIQTVLDIFDQLPQVRWITSRFPMQATKAGVPMMTRIMPAADKWGFFNGEHIRTSTGPSTGWIVQDCTFWRRDLWEEAGGRFDRSLKLAADFELWARFMLCAELYMVPTPLGIYRVQGENKAMAAAEAYRDECVKVLERHRGVVEEDPELLSERVIYKKMMSVGLGKLVTKSKRPIMKLISYNHDKGRYEAQDQNT